VRCGDGLRWMRMERDSVTSHVSGRNRVPIARVRAWPTEAWLMSIGGVLAQAISGDLAETL
jgi:hypothetical protein